MATGPSAPPSPCAQPKLQSGTATDATSSPARSPVISPNSGITNTPPHVRNAATPLSVSRLASIAEIESSNAALVENRRPSPRLRRDMAPKRIDLSSLPVSAEIDRVKLNGESSASLSQCLFITNTFCRLGLENQRSGVGRSGSSLTPSDPCCGVSSTAQESPSCWAHSAQGLHMWTAQPGPQRLLRAP